MDVYDSDSDDGFALDNPYEFPAVPSSPALTHQSLPHPSDFSDANEDDHHRAMQYRVAKAPPPTHHANKVLREYETFEEAVEYTREWTQECGYALKETHVKYKIIDGVRTTSIKYIACERAGKYRKSKLAEGDRKREDTATSLTDCKMRFSIKLSDTSTWSIPEITERTHNHEVVKLIESRVGRRRAQVDLIPAFSSALLAGIERRTFTRIS